MSSPRVREAVPPLRSRFRPRHIAAAVAAAAGAVAAIAVGLLLLGAVSGPSRVEAITVTNPTDFSLRVQVSGGDDSWLGLGTVAATDEHVFESVIDQGSIWVFEFHHANDLAARVETSRAALSDSDWEISIPAEAGERLTELGKTPASG